MTAANAATIQELRSADRELARRGHGAEIGTDIDDVGHEKQHDQRINEQRWVMSAHVAGEALPVTRPTCALIIWIAHING